MGLRVGIDLVAVADVEESLARHGARYLDRVYTSAEVDDCRHDGRVDASRLAARFAAKEATVKVLRTEVPWPSIEVRKEPSGAVELALTGAAADVAGASGLREFSLSVTHEAGLAAAVVVAVSDGTCRGTTT